MRKEVLKHSSFNGVVVALKNSNLTVMPHRYFLTASPYVIRMPLVKPEKGLLYIPNEWLEARVLIKNLTVESIHKNPTLQERSLLMSIVPASLALEKLKGRDLTVLTAHSQDPHFGTSLESLELHETHNLILSWVEDYGSAETVNLMM